MGLYDIVCGVQVKCTPNQSLKEYILDDLIELEDGIYIGYEGWFRVRNNVIIDKGKNIYDKWGNLLSLEKIMINNPVEKMIKSEGKIGKMKVDIKFSPELIIYFGENELGRIICKDIKDLGKFFEQLKESVKEIIEKSKEK